MLRISVPARGASADEKSAERSARKLRQAYHIDRLGKDYDNRRYLDVGEALDVIKQYNAALERKC